jgi:hypothetical protein
MPRQPLQIVAVDRPIRERSVDQRLDDQWLRVMAMVTVMVRAMMSNRTRRHGNRGGDGRGRQRDRRLGLGPWRGQHKGYYSGREA